jgi:deoxyuridine 5'-triphosphate nucleotidohydrolase
MIIEYTVADDRCIPEKHGSAMDLKAYIPKPIIIQPQQRQLIKTGVKINVPFGVMCHITPRSGLAYKHGVTIVNSPGIIDAGYIGDVGVILLITGDEPLLINPFDRIAQMSFLPLLNPHMQKVEGAYNNWDEYTNNNRKGFGSTGV